jgi:regulator of cell morphogenesis and NO signaling
MEPTEYQINNFPVDQVINFLKASHLFYRQVRLPEIRVSLSMLSATCSPMHGKALEKFFSEYNEEIEKHLSYEDKIVFPYIESLSNKEIEDAFTIRQFEEHHDDVEEKLDDLKNIIIKYIPEGENNEPRRLLLEKLFNFEEDLNRHILIENKLLVPIVTKLENNLR